jgi:hypothetical protein
VAEPLSPAYTAPSAPDEAPPPDGDNVVRAARIAAAFVLGNIALNFVFLKVTPRPLLMFVGAAAGLWLLTGRRAGVRWILVGLPIVNVASSSYTFMLMHVPPAVQGLFIRALALGYLSSVLYTAALLLLLVGEPDRRRLGLAAVAMVLEVALAVAMAKHVFF